MAAGNSFGQNFTITTYGESHGKALGLIIDGCPSGIVVDMDMIHRDLQRRKPGQSKITTQRKEEEAFEILSGVFEGKTTGTPISIMVRNTDQKSKDYSHIATKYRPSHADYTYAKKYGLRDYRGGGRSSARETVARVIGGAFAKMLLQPLGIHITSYVSRVGAISITDQDPIDYDTIEDNIIRCPSPAVAEKMISYIQEVKKDGDTIGGVISCKVKGCPVGLGAPVFDKLHADLAKAMLSINAVKGFEYGSGFRSVEMLGSEHNDLFIQNEDGSVSTETNYSGGIQGGISNGMDIDFNVAFKPVATIMQDQKSVDADQNETVVKGKGRHDPCVVPRAVPIVEAMAALVLADHYLRNEIVRVK